MPNSVTLEAEAASEPESGAKESADGLFEEHFEEVYRFFSRRVAEREDVQDLTAETFLAAVQRRPPRGVSPRCWLYGIARRKLADLLRKRRRQPDPQRLIHAAEVRSEAEARCAELRQLIAALPTAQAEALLLQALEDLSIAEIAHVMGKSEGSVKALLQRAKERIRTESKERLEPPEEI